MEWKNLLIRQQVKVKEALKRLDLGGEKILFVVDGKNTLLGTVTDGDIRRHILSGGKFDDTVSKLFNASPRVLDSGYTKDAAKKLMVETKIEAIPIIDKNKAVTGAINWTDLFGEKNGCASSTIDVPVVIMAGGKGERLDPFTKILPKPLIPIGEKPIVEVIIDKFLHYGVKHFYLTLNYKGEMVKIYFDSIDKEYKVEYIWEKDYFGTAGSLKILPESISDTFIVSNCDIIVEADYGDLLNFHKEKRNILTVVGSIQHHKIPYGVIHFKNAGKISKIEEKPEFDLTINTGVYVLSKKAINYIPRNKPFDMTDLINVLLLRKANVGVYPVSEKSYIDIGQWEEYRKHLERFVQ